ncbi:sensor domain-containing diguanylate cyclase [Vibrio fluvialis]|nr:sensor domain-containing diguanylate cyclase [Vibrio fluvialis]
MSKNFKNFVPLSITCITLLFTVSVVSVAYLVQQRYTKTMFENLADRQVQSLQQFVNSDIHFIGSGANFFHSVSPMSWSRFRLYANELLKGSKSLIGLQWLQRVEEKNIPAYEAKMRKRYPDFSIYTVPEGGAIVPGYHLDGKPIFVVTDIVPRTPANMGLLGFYASRERFELAVDYISTTTQPSVSDKIRLLQDGRDSSVPKDGLLIYHPVFDQYRHHLLGVMVGVIRLSVYFDELVLKTAAEHQMALRVVDTGFDSEDDPVLYQSDNWQHGEGLQVTRRVELPNREWLVDFRLPQPLTQNDKWILIGLGIGGGMISLLLGFVSHLLIREKETLNTKLEERTKELRFMVEHDSLTGIFNRRAFNRILDVYVRDQKPFTLVSFDIDNFKSINDRYSHLAGDQVLVAVTKTIETLLDPADIFVRTGGDEFSILCHVTEPEQLKSYLETIRRTVELSRFDTDYHQLSVSLSIGAAINEGYSEQELLQRADTMLYESKAKGRNQVSIAD